MRNDAVKRLCRLVWHCALLALALPCAFAQPAPLPPTLRDTGFFDAANRIAFSPQYPLWSDGADKERTIALPAGHAIDASNPDAWDFPRGTRLWKTFSHAGRPIETRLIERLADGSWRYAAYVWSDDGRDADLAPARGIVLSRAEAPGGRYAVPGRGDCLACHAGATVPVLGFAALQLSGARDANAVHGRPMSATELDLRALVERGLLRNLPPALAGQPPRIAAASPIERAALGYLHGNCAQCHHANEGRVPLKLNLMQRVADAESGAADVLRSLVNAPSRYQPPGQDDPRVVVPGDAASSVLALRMHTRDPRVQMPPLGTEQIDRDGLALLTRWIQHDLPHRSPP